MMKRWLIFLTAVLAIAVVGGGWLLGLFIEPNG